MPWNPDSGDALTSATISVTDVEATSMAIWNEFLTGWFDGNGHVLADSYVPFPTAAKVSFQDMALPTNLEGLCLTVVTTRPSTAFKRLWNDGKWRLTEKCRIDFYFRASVKTARSDGHNSVSLVRLGSDRLFAVLSSKDATKHLTYRGMGAVRPQPPVVVSTGNTIPMRLVSATVTYTYPAEEGATTVLVNADPRTYRFKDGYLQVWNPDTELFHGVFATGNPVQLAIFEDGEAASDNAIGTAAPTFRFKGTKQLQFWNAELGKWHTTEPDGVQYPQFSVDEAGEDAGDNPLAATVARTYRFRDGIGLQLKNAATGLWHTLAISGTRPTFTISQEGQV